MMKPHFTRRAIVVTFVTALIAAAYFGWKYYKRQNAVECVLDWGRLAPLPSTARNVQAYTSDSALTREFHVSFTAAPDDIGQWLADSPGIRDATVENDGTTTTYCIRAGGGADFAKVAVEHASATVRIHVIKLTDEARRLIVSSMRARRTAYTCTGVESPSRAHTVAHSI